MMFNKTLNLIGPGSIGNADLLHFADGVFASQIIHGQISDEPLFDIGSGNGIPGLIYAILYPKAPVTLVEHDQRKTEFLRTVASRLKLTNVQVLAKSFEQLPPDSMKFAMARGFASIPKTLFLARKVVQKDGRFFHIKGTEWPLEIGEMPTQLCSFWASGLVSGYSIEELSIQYFVVASQKIK
jgi:16S rRNA (guanine527-N7)-methyltransferase